MEKIFISGATGFIGSNLACKLANQGFIIHALIRNSSDISSIKHRNINLYQGDLLDLESIEAAIKGCSQVYHLAAYAKNWAPDKMLFHKINVDGTKNILRAAKNNSVQKIVYTSTSLVFGPSKCNEIDESGMSNANPYTGYDQSKIIAEDIIHKFISEGMNIVTVYPTRVFGPGVLNESNAVTNMILKYMDGSWRLTLSDGKALGNYVFVDDVVEGHIDAMNYGKMNSKYIIGGINRSYNDFFKEINNIIGRLRIMLNIPASVALLHSKIEEELANRFNRYPMITPGWVKLFLDDWAFTSDKAINEINYNITPLKTALERTIDWIEKNKKNNHK
jgi:farnesol dehydrogenase